MILLFSHSTYFTHVRMIDRDHDGWLSVGELRQFLTSLGDKMTEQEVGEMVRLLRPDTGGRVSCEGRLVSWSQHSKY